MREKLAKHVKGVGEKKIRGNKERTCHRLSPSITNTLAFHPYTTIFPITRSTRNEKYKGERRRTTNLNCLKLQHREENPNSGSPQCRTPRGLLKASGGKGPWGQSLAPKYWRNGASTAMETRQKPHFHGYTRLAVRCRFASLSAVPPGSSI